MKSKIKKDNENKGNLEKKGSQKVWVSLLSAVLLAFLYMLIFSFSEQDGAESGSLSHLISQKCVELINALAGGNWTELFKENLVTYFENPIRKLAHFAEYALMGVLLYGVWRPWKQRTVKLYFLIIIWILVSAAGDEIHQLFVPGRCGSAADVLLDTCGGGFGLFCCVTVEKLCMKRIKSRHVAESGINVWLE